MILRTSKQLDGSLNGIKLDTLGFRTDVAHEDLLSMIAMKLRNSWEINNSPYDRSFLKW